MNVADYIADYLVRNGVRHVFGYPGSAIMKVITSIVDTGEIEYVQNYHEQASAFGADAYARIDGNVGVAVATSGPGATNLITGIANAQLDSVPTLFITGQENSQFIKDNGARLNGFQDLDIVSVVRPITKYAAAVMDPGRIRYELEKALHLAKSGRPGATLLDIPIDIQFKDIDPDGLPAFVPEAEPAHDRAAAAEVYGLLRQAERPLVLLGGGVRIAGAERQVAEFLDATGIPAVATANGLDAYADAVGFAGLYGNTHANLAAYNADVLLVLGARLGLHHVGKVPEAYTRAKVIHVDIDPTELGRVFPDSITVQADLRAFVTELNAVAAASRPDISPWRDQIEAWRRQYGANTHVNPVGIDPVAFIEALMPQLADDAIITADVGQNQMWVAQAFGPARSRRLLNSTGLGSMGYSLPAAVGAKFARHDAQVVCFTGDGGLHMNLQELILVGQRQLDMTCIVFNNNTLGMMRAIQRAHYGNRFYGTTDAEFTGGNLAKLAEAFGLAYLRVDSAAQLALVVEAVHDPRPHLVDVRLPQDTQLLVRSAEAHIYEKNKIA